jgi:hypothetical protein
MSDRWTGYLRRVFRSGQAYHSREMFDLFLTLIDDGTLDGVRPGFAMNDDWWTVLYSVAKERPDLASEAIGHWLDRAVETWHHPPDGLTTDKSTTGSNELWRHLDRSGNGRHVIEMAGKAPLAFGSEILPRVAKLVAETAKDQGDHLAADPLWTFRSFGSNSYHVHGSLLSVLVRSLEFLAKHAPADHARRAR